MSSMLQNKAQEMIKLVKHKQTYFQVSLFFGGGGYTPISGNQDPTSVHPKYFTELH